MADQTEAAPSELPTAAADKTLRVCVVGAGAISREFALHHFTPASSSTVVTSIVDLNATRAASLAADVGAVQAGALITTVGRKYESTVTKGAAAGRPVPHATSLSAVLESCDIVFVGVPPMAHASLVLEALAAGKHVLLEKPVAATAADADAIVTAAEAAAPALHLGLDIGMRWNPALHELRRLAVTEAALGALISARLSLRFMTWPRAWQRQPWCAQRLQGGPLREVGTHFFFGIMECFGHGCVRRVVASVVYADDDGAEGSAAETTVHGTIELVNGLAIALEVLTDGVAAAAEGEDAYEFEVVGENGALLLDRFDTLKCTAPEDKIGWVVEDGSYGRIESVTSLVDAIRGERSAADCGVISAREGRNAQRVLDAILASGGEWLEVNYD